MLYMEIFGTIYWYICFSYKIYHIWRCLFQSQVYIPIYIYIDIDIFMYMIIIYIGQPSCLLVVSSQQLQLSDQVKKEKRRVGNISILYALQNNHE